MAWTTLKDRINSPGLPLILAGPILRHTDLSSVTVWVALREKRTVTLTVYRGTGATRKQVLAGSREAVKLGKHLNVVSVTAGPVGGGDLVPGEIYYYDLDFGSNQKLGSPDILKLGSSDTKSITYGDDDLPSFALPPMTLDKLRLVHGSCRKPHASGKDAMPAVDLMIEEAKKEAETKPAESRASAYAEFRPHQLFLTGDQIYADDVADDLLEVLTEAGDTLLGWEETLPGVNKKPKELKPGTRGAISRDTAGLTSAITDPIQAKSHLFSLGEYYAMYLFAWSDVLWPSELPSTAPGAERSSLVDFKTGLPQVRKALANIPTYMIFDDHDVTDDWFMNREFCNRVLNKELGKRVIQNALLAYAVFQAWGNTPLRFWAGTGAVGEQGRELLKAAVDLHAAAEADGTESAPAKDALKRIGERVGLPTSKPNDATALVRPSGALEWHYRIALPGYPYEVLVLDCRTAREYPARSAPNAVVDDLLPPGLLKPDAFDKQIDPASAPSPDGVTIVVSPGPVVGIPWIEEIQRIARGDDILQKEVEPWGLNQKAFQTLLAKLLMRRRRVVILSGDVHYGFAARLAYRAIKPFGARENLPAQRTAVLVQLTASAFKNQKSETSLLFFESGTLALHTGGFTPSADPAMQRITQLRTPVELFTPLTNDFAGWNKKLTPADVVIGHEKAHWFQPEANIELFEGTPPVLRLYPAPPRDTKICLEDDWLYRIEFITGTLAVPGQTPSPALEQVPSNKQQAAEATKALSKAHDTARKGRHGRQIVGVNNLGEVRFVWPVNDDKKVIQKLWWRITDASVPFPMTTYEISLKPSDPSPGSIKRNCLP